MKKFEVEFKKTSWMAIAVEAESEEDAENKGFAQLEAEGFLS